MSITPIPPVHNQIHAQILHEFYQQTTSGGAQLQKIYLIRPVRRITFNSQAELRVACKAAAIIRSITWEDWQAIESRQLNNRNSVQIYSYRQNRLVTSFVQKYTLDTYFTSRTTWDHEAVKSIFPNERNKNNSQPTCSFVSGALLLGAAPTVIPRRAHAMIACNNFMAQTFQVERTGGSCLMQELN